MAQTLTSGSANNSGNANFSTLNKIVLSSDGLVLKEIPLLDKQRMTIGRKPSNDIQIDNLAVSGEHAVILNYGRDVFIEDLDSTNGIQVNGKAVRRHQLVDNDTITIAKYTIKFIVEIDTTVDNISMDSVSWDNKAVLAVTQSMANELMPPPAPESAANTLEGLSIATPAIRVVKGGSKGKGMELIKQVTTLGRPGVLVVGIVREVDGYYLKHIEGTERPSINGIPMVQSRKLLKEKDLINIAGSEMEFYLKK